MSTDSGATERPDAETTAVLADIRIAEEQIAHGEGIDHDAAERLVLARFAQPGPKAEPR